MLEAIVTTKGLRANASRLYNGARQHVAKRAEEALILLPRSDRDAHPLRQPVGIHRPHDHAAPLQGVEYSRAIADFNQHEIRHTGNGFQPELTTSGFELL